MMFAMIAKLVWQNMAVIFNVLSMFLTEVIHFIKSSLTEYQNNLSIKHEKRNILSKLENKLCLLFAEARLIGLNDEELSILINQRIDLNFNSNLTTVTTGSHKIVKNIFSKKHILILFLPFLFLTSLLTTCTSCKRFALRYGRRIIFQLEPHWNWQDVYYDRCLFSIAKSSLNNKNRWLSPSGNLPEPYSCDFCEDVNQITEIVGPQMTSVQTPNKDLLEDQITFLIANSLPFIYHGKNLSDEIKSWPIHQNFTSTNDFRMFYQADTNSGGVCMFRSNLINANSPTNFFPSLDERMINSWFVHWENCLLEQSKKIRRLYKRPQILPPMIEMSKPNWLLISSSSLIKQDEQQNQQQMIRTFKSIVPSSRQTDLIVIIQIHGHIELQVKSIHSGCHQICPPLKLSNHSTEQQVITLRAYNLIVVDAKHWRLSYRPKTNYYGSSISDSNINLSLVLAGILV